ncbi:cell cycle control protein [Brettanomyces bruxellensis AWRI1499]|nr:cell cycle control protein [Brettanomyces bruxellensis AWRI1499]
MICSLSGEPTIHPALSLKSKKVFDKKLIREYVQQNGKDPMTGESMTLSDIIPIEISASDIIKGPRKSNQDSIPSMLAMFQNEWDALTLELFDLRKQVTELKKEAKLSIISSRCSC